MRVTPIRIDSFRRRAFASTDPRQFDYECPICTGANSTVLPRRRRPDYWFSINAPRKCADCKNVFLPPAGNLARLMTVLFGAFFLIALLALEIRPAVEEGVSAGTVVKCICILPLVWCMLRAAFRSGRARPLPE